MISFLNGFILPALAAATIPILLHFLSKKKAKKIPFSSIKFLKAIENQRIRRVKLYQILLIIVRTLFIIFLVLAFTRPTISDYSANGSNTQTTAFIIIDDSYSMQAYAHTKTYYELAVEKLHSILDAFNENDAVFLYTRTGIISLTTDKNEPLLNQLSVSNDVLDIKKSLIAADSVFKSHINLNNELYMLSDFKFDLENDINSYFEDVRNFTAFKISLSDNIPFKNISIDTVIVENQLLEVNQPVKITAFVTNHSETDTETNLNLFAGDERAGMQFIALNAKQKDKIDVLYTPKTTGIHNLVLQLDEDDLSIDNHWYFSLNMPEEINILFISTTISTEVNAALKILSENTIFDIKNVNYNEWPGLNLQEYDLIVLNDLPKVTNNSVEPLKAFYISGKSVILIPGDETDLNTFNTFTNVFTGYDMFSEFKTADNKSYFLMEDSKSENPFFSTLFRDKKSSFSAPKIYKYFKQSKMSESIINLVNNDPFISKTDHLITFNSSLNNSWNDLVINGLFLPLMYRIVYYTTQNNNPVLKNFMIGDDIILTSQNGTLSDTYHIYEPDSKNYTVIPVLAETELVFKGGKAEIPGIYSLTRNNKLLTTISVNLSSRELDFSGNEDFGFVTIDSENFVSKINEFRVGYELWIFLLVLALIMLILEMILIKIIEGTSLITKA